MRGSENRSLLRVYLNICNFLCIVQGFSRRPPMISSCIWMFSNTSVNISSVDVFCWESLQDSELGGYLMMFFQYQFFSWMCHSYLAEDTAGSWFLFSSLSLLSFSFTSANFEVRFLNLRSLDLDFFSLRSSGISLSWVPPFLSLSELMLTSKPVWDRCVAEMWDVRCTLWHSYGWQCKLMIVSNPSKDLLGFLFALLSSITALNLVLLFCFSKQSESKTHTTTTPSSRVEESEGTQPKLEKVRCTKSQEHQERIRIWSSSWYRTRNLKVAWVWG